jgi:hypothetical protein
VCLKCDQSCYGCTTYGSSSCCGCSNGYFLLADRQTCVASCPNGFAEKSIGRECIACDDGCNFCTYSN